jgi:hypothetical protein
MSDDKQHPAYKGQLGSVQIAVWANTAEVDGAQRTFHTATLERNYKDKDDAWHKTTQLRERDLGDAIALLQRAQAFLIHSNAT